MNTTKLKRHFIAASLFAATIGVLAVITGSVLLLIAGIVLAFGTLAVEFAALHEPTLRFVDHSDHFAHIDTPTDIR